MKSKFLSDEEYQEFLDEKRRYYETVSLDFIAHSLLSKYGFNDGDSIPHEIDDVIKKRATELAEILDGVCGLKSYVVKSGHNPYFVAFETDEDYYHYDELPLEVQWKIDKVLKEKLDE